MNFSILVYFDLHLESWLIAETLVAWFPIIFPQYVFPIKFDGRSHCTNNLSTRFFMLFPNSDKLFPFRLPFSEYNLQQLKKNCLVFMPWLNNKIRCALLNLAIISKYAQQNLSFCMIFSENSLSLETSNNTKL